MTTFKHILVPLDGSPLAERTLPYAQSIAAAGPGSLVLLRVIPPVEDHHAADRTTVAEAEGYLADVAGRLAPLATETAVVEGDPTQVIRDEVAQRGIDLVAMSTHGRSGIGRWIYGSVADAVLRHAPVPVLLVSATAQVARWPSDRPLRILLTLDYSAVSEAVLEPAGALADTLKAELILLSVTPLLTSPDPYGGAFLAYDPEQDRAERRQYLEGIAVKQRAAGRTVKVCDAFGLIDSSILDVARSEGVDLIAMATHGSGGVTRLMMGSVASSIVQRATVPLLVIRPTLPD
jgi:nucleotide-binding universal stress UspA family protein